MNIFGKSNKEQKRDNRLKCSFCGKSQEVVKKLIAGPGVYICDECVGLCLEILDEEDLGKSQPGTTDFVSELPFQADLDASLSFDEELNTLIDKILDPLEKLSDRYKELCEVDCFEPGIRNIVALKSIKQGKLNKELLPLLTTLGTFYRNHGQLNAAKNTYCWALEICDSDKECDEKNKRFYAIELAKLLMKTGEFKEGEELLDRIGHSL